MKPDCALTICRGCCCGTDDPKRAAARLEYLRQRLNSVQVRTSDCLGPCDRRDVIVVHPHARRRQQGQGPVWLARMHTKPAMDELIGWLEAGGPGQALMPVELTYNAFRPPSRRKRSRRVG